MTKLRRGRLPRAYARRGPTKEPYDVVLMVCEGSKTEPLYLQGLKVFHRLSNANIRILHPNATDPMSIAHAAEDESAANQYDKIFCIFDRDGHAQYSDALRIISNSNGRVFAVNSVPCFEVWVLLHFQYTSAPFTSVGRESACDKVLQELRRYMPDYAKGRINVYAELLDRLDTAIGNAHRLEAHNVSTSSDNPETKMHHLVQYLRSLKVP
jgi:hypothetical protein